MKHHLEFIDILRGVAVLIVFSFHCFTAAFHTDRFNLVGEAGVAIFFAISGFCIHLSFSRKRGWGVFWMRRFFRLYPAYLLAVVLCSVGPLRDAWQLSSHLLMVHNLFVATIYGLNSDFWSIAVEVQLYAIYPLLLLLVRNFGWQRTLWLIGIIEFGLRIFVGFAVVIGVKVPVWFIGMPFFYWFSWSVGAGVAESYLKAEKFTLASCYAKFFIIAGIFSAFVMNTLWFPFYAIAAAGLIAKAIQYDRPIKYPPILSRHLAQTGLWSYSFYLIHHPLIGLTAVELNNFALPVWIFFILYLALYPLILGIAGGIYRYVEHPGIQVGNWLIKGKTLFISHVLLE